jgi:retron-type reverse transcriptase
MASGSATVIGVNEVTAEQYQENLEANLQDLVERLKQKRFRTKLERRGYFASKKERLLEILALEDKLRQLINAVAAIFNIIVITLVFINVSFVVRWALIFAHVVGENSRRQKA